jgi:hypothetical protein
MQGEDERRVAAAIQGEVGMDYPVVGVDDVRSLRGHHLPQAEHRVGVRHRRCTVAFRSAAQPAESPERRPHRVNLGAVALARLCDPRLLDGRYRDVMPARDELCGLILDHPLLAPDDGSE